MVELWILGAAAAAEQANNWTAIGLVIGGILVAFGGGGAGGAALQRRRTNGNSEPKRQEGCPLHRDLANDVVDIKTGLASMKGDMSYVKGQVDILVAKFVKCSDD